MIVIGGAATVATARHTTAKIVRRIMQYLRGIGKTHARTGARGELSFRLQFIRRPFQIRGRRYSATISKWLLMSHLRTEIFISCACDRVFGRGLIEGSRHKGGRHCEFPGESDNSEGTPTQHRVARVTLLCRTE